LRAKQARVKVDTSDFRFIAAKFENITTKQKEDKHRTKKTSEDKHRTRQEQMLQYLHLKSTKFEVGQQVEVKSSTGQTPRLGVVIAIVGNNYYEVEFEGGERDPHVSARHMRLPIDGGHENNKVFPLESSMRSTRSVSTDLVEGGTSGKNILNRMYNRLASISHDNYDQGPGVENEPKSSSVRMGFSLRRTSIASSGSSKSNASHLPDKDNGSKAAATAAAAAAASTAIGDQKEDENLAVVGSTKKKKTARRKLFTEVELHVLERVRQCTARMKSNGQNMALARLDLSHLQLQSIPTQCESVAFVRELSVRKNEFRAIDDVVHMFPSVTRLDVAYNLFIQDPNDLRELATEDSELIRTEKQSTSPFAAFANVQVLRLTWLDLSGCRLTSLPDELKLQSATLMTFIVRKNQLTSLPEWLSTFLLLSSLDCADNQIPLSKSLCVLLEEQLLKLSDINFDRNPCMDDLERDQRGEKLPEDAGFIGPKIRYLLQKVRLFSWCSRCQFIVVFLWLLDDLEIDGPITRYSETLYSSRQ
jgi:hypothetical protein